MPRPQAQVIGGHCSVHTLFSVMVFYRFDLQYMENFINKIL